MKRYLRFTAAMVFIAAVWLVVLPLIGEQPVIARHIAEQRRLGINPSAKFYSEHECMPAIAHRLESLNLLRTTAKTLAP